MNVLFTALSIPYPSSGAPVHVYYTLKNLKNANFFNGQVVCHYRCNSETNIIEKLEKELKMKIYISKINPHRLILNKIAAAVTGEISLFMSGYNTRVHTTLIKTAIKSFSPDIIHCHELSEAVPTLNASKDFKIKRVITMHNVEHLLLFQRSNIQKSALMRLAYKRALRKFKEYEVDTLSEFDHIFVVSDNDKKVFISEGIQKEKLSVVPNGVDCDYFKPRNTVTDSINVLFMGTLSYDPNLVAVRIYLENIHPIIKKEFQDFRFYVVGKNPPKWLKKYAQHDPSVVVTGFVEDVRPYIMNVDVCIAPLTVGSGTRLKILEYMAMGKPVVSTTIGAEGLEIDDGKNILIADDWSEFADKIIELLNDDHLAKKIGTNGRKLVEEKYDWKKIAEKQIKLYEKLLGE